MKAYSQFLKELPSKKVVFAFGAFQPPTISHELLVKTVDNLATEQKAEKAIYASINEDLKKNPIPPHRKAYYLKRMFPEANIRTAESLLQVAKKLNEKYKNAVMVAPSDRVAEYQNLLEKHNAKEYNFDSIMVVSSGQLDPDADTTKLREAVKKGDLELFKESMPQHFTTMDTKRLMNEMRQGMGLELIKEQVKLATDYLRESYYRGEIFKIGELVESNGQRFEIIDRGSNYLVVVDSVGTTHRKWITDVKVVEDYSPDNPSDIDRDEDDTQVSYKGYTTKNFDTDQQAKGVFDRLIAKPDLDPVAILNLIKATDLYFGVAKDAEDKDEITKEQEKVFGDNLQKAQQLLVKMGDIMNHINYMNHTVHTVQQVKAKYHTGTFPDTFGEEFLSFKELLEMKFTATDKIKVARIIANSLGVVDSEKNSNPEQLVNNALRKVRNKPMRPEYVSILHNMLQTAREAGIEYDEKLVPSKVSEETIAELSTDLLARYKTGAHASAKAADASGNYSKGDKRFKGINKATFKQFDNDLKKHKQNVPQPGGTNAVLKLDTVKEEKPCWSNYKMVGMKKKGNKQVPNCVPEETQIDEISQKLAGNYYGAATKKHIEKVGVKPDMYGRIEKDMGKNRKAGVDRALDRVTGVRKTNEDLDEGKRPGLWDNIHAKQERIKNGSKERMRKPGSKGAPTAAAFRASQNEEVVSEDIKKEYDSLKKNHDIKSLRGLIKTQHKIIDTSEFKTKDHAISHYLRTKHGNKKVAAAFGLSEDFETIEEAAIRKPEAGMHGDGSDVLKFADYARLLGIQQPFSASGEKANDDLEAKYGDTSAPDVKVAKSYQNQTTSQFPVQPKGASSKTAPEGTPAQVSPANIPLSLHTQKTKYRLGEEVEFEELDEESFYEEIDAVLELEDIIDAYEDKELLIVDEDTDEEYQLSDLQEEESLDEAISRMDRIRRKQRWARTKSKREMRTKIALKKTSSMPVLNSRAKRLAINMIKKRMLRKDPSKASVPEKERVEKFIKSRPQVVQRLAKRLVPRVRQVEKARLRGHKYTPAGKA